ncbi:NPHS1 [Cordylochernes scorpioides]|uniref:NPHS1 n=1 Tax=Cordylochernes scorpioides TaxID=51811 RepID=A0ABY6LUF5_9ARAC|nr:NPHS1 [Cordylochernes scorpioides]
MMSVVKAQEGHNATINLTAKANPDRISYRWTVGDNYLPRAIKADGGVLYFRDVRRIQAKTYRVQASNPLGTTETNVFLDVQCKRLCGKDLGRKPFERSLREGFYPIHANWCVSDPPNITVFYDQVLAQPGNDVHLECLVTGNPLPQEAFHWRRENVDYSDRASASNLTESGTLSYLSLYNVTTDESGVFECYVDNGIGEASAFIWLIVEQTDDSNSICVAEKPIMMGKAGRFSQESGSMAQLICQVRAAPNVTFYWTRENQRLEDNDKYDIDSNGVADVDRITWNSTLTIKEVDSTDHGEYVCVAQNVLGFAKFKFNLTVLCKSLPLNSTVLRWRVRHILIQGAEDENHYRSSSAPPDSPYGLKVLNISTNSVVLTWTPSFSGGMDQAFLVRYRVSGNQVAHVLELHPPNSTTYLIDQLRPKTTYFFQVRAYNDRGKSDYSPEQVQVTTLEGTSYFKLTLKHYWKYLLGVR